MRRRGVRRPESGPPGNCVKVVPSGKCEAAIVPGFQARYYGSGRDPLARGVQGWSRSIDQRHSPAVRAAGPARHMRGVVRREDAAGDTFSPGITASAIRDRAPGASIQVVHRLEWAQRPWWQRPSPPRAPEARRGRAVVHRHQVDHPMPQPSRRVHGLQHLAAGWRSGRRRASVLAGQREVVGWGCVRCSGTQALHQRAIWAGVSRPSMSEIQADEQGRIVTFDANASRLVAAAGDAQRAAGADYCGGWLLPGRPPVGPAQTPVSTTVRPSVLAAFAGGRSAQRSRAGQHPPGSPMQRRCMVEPRVAVLVGPNQAWSARPNSSASSPAVNASAGRSGSERGTVKCHRVAGGPELARGDVVLAAVDVERVGWSVLSA